MIASLTGTVIAINIDSVVISVGGVGMHVLCSPAVIAKVTLGHEASLHTSLIVREDSLTLFGFSDVESRELFDIVQSVSGFGPKLAFTIIATFEADDLRRAIGSGDVARLTKTPGVGSKGAQRLILELKDKIGFVGGASVAHTDEPEWHDQVSQALVGLGWNAREAQKAIDAVDHAGVADPKDVASLLRLALQVLAN